MLFGSLGRLWAVLFEQCASQGEIFEENIPHIQPPDGVPYATLRFCGGFFPDRISFRTLVDVYSFSYPCHVSDRNRHLDYLPVPAKETGKAGFIRVSITKRPCDYSHGLFCCRFIKSAIISAHGRCRRLRRASPLPSRKRHCSRLRWNASGRKLPLQTPARP